MTEKLFYKDSHLFETAAVVEKICLYEGKPAVVLNRTVFFPEGGGQPGDTGKIGGAEITDTQEKDGVIYHIFRGEKDFAEGETVACRLDESRFYRMQAHTGEHIVSGVAHRLYGVENVGFHMDDLVMTVDFDRYLTKEELFEVEKQANDCIFSDVAVTTEIFADDKYIHFDYRSKLDSLDRIRLVTIKDVDRCACCAPHVSRTGEIGTVKILSSVSHRGGVRLTLIAGKKAFDYLGVCHNSVVSVASMIKTPHDEIDTGTEALLKKNSELKYEINLLHERIAVNAVESIVYSEKACAYYLAGLTADELSQAASVVSEKAKAVTCLFSSKDGGGYCYAVTGPRSFERDFVRDVNLALDGRGGGKDNFFRGTFNAERSAIENFFDGLEV